MVALSRLCTAAIVALVAGPGTSGCESRPSDDEATARLEETIARVDERLAALDERLAQIEAKAQAAAREPSEATASDPEPGPTIAPVQPKPTTKIEIACEGERYRIDEATYDLPGLTALLERAVDEGDPSVTIQCERGDTEAVTAALDAARSAGVEHFAMMAVD